MRRKAVKHENFFIAKVCDSESVQRASGPCRRLAMTLAAARPITARIKEMTAAQPLHAMLTFTDVGPARVFCFASRSRCCALDDGAAHALTSVRQHFLKLEAVF